MMYAAGMELEHLTESERDQILQVLQRDDNLRQREQERIRKLRSEVKQVRLKGVIKEGQDATNSCARCRKAFGWFFNKGDICPNCQHRVCNSCQEKNGNTWLCVLCYKQMELEAMTNFWFYSKFRKSKRNKRTNQIVSGSDIIRKSIRRPNHGTTLAGNSLTEEVKRALSNNNSSPKQSPLRGRSPVDGETSDTQSVDNMKPIQRTDAAIFPQEDDKQMLKELIKPRRPNGAMLQEHHRVEVKRVTSNRYKDSDSDSDSAPSSPFLSSRNESMFTHTESPRSSVRSSSAVSSEGRITIVTDIGGVSDMEVASVDMPIVQQHPELTHQDVERYVSDPRGYGYRNTQGNYPPQSTNSRNSQSSENHPDDRKSRETTTPLRSGSGQNDIRSERGYSNNSPVISQRKNPFNEGNVYERDNLERSSHKSSPHGTPRATSSVPSDRSQRSHRDSPTESHKNTESRSENSHMGLPYQGSSRSDRAPSRNHQTPTHRKHQETTAREVYSTSSDSDRENRLKQPTVVISRSRTPSPEVKAQSHHRKHRSDRGKHTTGAGNGQLSPPVGERGNQSPSSECGSSRRALDAHSTKPTPTATDNDSVKVSSPVPSVNVTASPRSNRSGLSNSEAEEDDNIDQLFASHVSMSSQNDSKRSSNLLSPFSSSRESILSYYSNAGEGNYGKIPITGDIMFGLDYNYKNGYLEVYIKQCKDLAPVDKKRNRSDPYIKTYLLPDKTKSGKRKTRVKKHTLNPTFEEALRYHITKSELENRTLWITVWHNDTFGRNDFLGEVNIPMDDYNFTNSQPKWYQLQERYASPLAAKMSYKGDLVVSLKFVTSDNVMSKHHRQGNERGELHVLVKEARNLTAVRANGTSDPFCKGYLLPERTKHTKQKTSVKKKDLNPKWNHTFVFEEIARADLLERCLELAVWDHDRFTSNDFLGGIRLGLGTGTSGGRVVDWMDSMGEEITIWQEMLDKPNTWIDRTIQLRSNMDGRH